MRIEETARSIVENGRRDAYGHPLDNFENIAYLWSFIVGRVLDAEQVGLMMVLLKIARQKHTHQDDNFVDAIGYLIATYEARLEAERRGLG